MGYHPKTKEDYLSYDDFLSTHVTYEENDNGYLMYEMKYTCTLFEEEAIDRQTNKEVIISIAEWDEFALFEYWDNIIDYIINPVEGLSGFLLHKEEDVPEDDSKMIEMYYFFNPFLNIDGEDSRYEYDYGSRNTLEECYNDFLNHAKHYLESNGYYSDDETCSTYDSFCSAHLTANYEEGGLFEFHVSNAKEWVACWDLETEWEKIIDYIDKY
jgi:hypothetical protein